MGAITYNVEKSGKGNEYKVKDIAQADFGYAGMSVLFSLDQLCVSTVGRAPAFLSKTITLHENT
jgi:hypothetical protein